MQGCVWERERGSEREWATAINAVLMHYIKIPGTDKVSHGVQCAKRDKGGVVGWWGGEGGGGGGEEGG